MTRSAQTIVAYAAALLGPPLLAVIFPIVFPPVLGKAVFMPFVFLVLGAAWLRGIGPGLVAALCSALACVLVLPPDLRVRVDTSDQRIILFFFLLLAGSISWVCERLRRQGAQAAQQDNLREKAEDAARYQTALLAGRMGSWETDFITGTRIWSAPGMALFGIDLPDGRGHVGGPLDEWIAAVHPDDRHLLPAIIAQGETLDAFPAEYRILRPDGTVVWLSGRGMVMSRQPNGKPARYINVMADVTEHRKAEEALRVADRRKDEFLAVLAHELRNPIAPISNALQIMRLGASDTPALAAPRRIIERQIAQLVRLVDDLLDVSRITQGKLILRTRPTSLRGIVESAVEASAPLIEARGHTLTQNLPEQDIRLSADPARLAQVLSNLLNNAAKYTDEGGRITLTVRREGSRAVVEVSDTGIGIPPDRLADIFTMFTQIESAREGTRSGLGIGLTLVKELVELHGGTVEAASGAGGSTFTVRLPAEAVADAGGDTLPPATGTPAPTGHRILVVDDNADSADSLVTLLQMLGNDCTAAYDGPEALQVADKIRPQLVLLDIGLPSMSGYEVAQQLRQRPWARGLVLVALTGWGQGEDRRKSSEAGFDHHLVKPVEFADLERIIHALAVGG